MLTPAELTRYGRQLLLPEVGLEGQARLRAASVLIVGAGGLGSPVALYLAAAGVGMIGILDDDRVELSNLHRQILHGTTDLERSKTSSAVEALGELNPHVSVRAHGERLTSRSADALFASYDIVVDGSDNYATRYAINDACARLGKTWIYGSVERFSGQVSVFAANGPCYRCLFPEAPAAGTSASCEEIGVLGAVPGVVGTLQAVETLKWILKVGEPLVGRLMTLDLRAMDTRVIEFERRQDCPACGAGSSGEMDAAAKVESNGAADIEPAELAARLRGRDALSLLDIREPWEWNVGRIGEPRMLPMNDLPSMLESLDRAQELIVYCHHGVRSSMAADWLRSQGFRARNLAGGIDRWSREVDPAVPRY